MPSDILHHLNEISKVDFNKIKEIEETIANEKENALEFIRDANAYMRKHMTGSYLPKALHFHIQLADHIFPTDTVASPDQVTVTTSIKLAASFKDEVIAEIQRLQLQSPPVKPLYCDGCSECKIAILS